MKMINYTLRFKLFLIVFILTLTGCSDKPKYQTGQVEIETNAEVEVNQEVDYDVATKRLSDILSKKVNEMELLNERIDILNSQINPLLSNDGGTDGEQTRFEQYLNKIDSAIKWHKSLQDEISHLVSDKESLLTSNKQNSDQINQLQKLLKTANKQITASSEKIMKATQGSDLLKDKLATLQKESQISQDWSSAMKKSKTVWN